MDEDTCINCHDEIEGEPAARIFALAEIDFKQVPAIVDPGVDSRQEVEGKVCGDCIAEAAPVVNLDINLNGGPIFPEKIPVGQTIEAE